MASVLLNGTWYMVCEMVELQHLATDWVESQFDPAVRKAVRAHVVMGGIFGLSKLGDIFFARLLTHPSC
jgi:hypothetical protein